MGGEQAAKGGEARRLGERSKAIDGGDFVPCPRCLLARIYAGLYDFITYVCDLDI